MAYGEGFGGSLPPRSESVNANPQDINGNDKLIRARRFQYAIPATVMSQNLMSGTSDAKQCFIHRKNSRHLQKHLLNYTMIIVGAFNITLEN